MADQREFYIYTLGNGIRCIFKRIKSPVAYCALTVGAGSRDETKSEHGIAHFAEHAMFKGTNRRRAYQINSRLEKLGGELNAFTTKEETVVHATSLRGDISKAAELLADVVFNSTFPTHEVDKEREVILDEINSYKDSPPERIFDEFEDIIFKGSPLGHNILGSRGSVARITGEDIAAFVRRCYNTDQIVFSVAADITERGFHALAERYFGQLPASSRLDQRHAPPLLPPFERAVRRSTHQAHCIVGARAYGNNDPRRIPLSLLVNMLGGPAANSMLNILLREKNGLTYTVDAAYNAYCDSGIVSIYFGTDKDKTARCLDLITGTLNRLSSEPLTSRQLSMAKKQFIGQLSIAMEAREGYMLSAAKSLLVYGEVDSTQTLYRKIMAVTQRDIMDAAQESFMSPSYLIYT